MTHTISEVMGNPSPRAERDKGKQSCVSTPFCRSGVRGLVGRVPACATISRLPAFLPPATFRAGPRHCHNVSLDQFHHTLFLGMSSQSCTYCAPELRNFSLAMCAIKTILLLIMIQSSITPIGGALLGLSTVPAMLGMLIH